MIPDLRSAAVSLLKTLPYAVAGFLVFVAVLNRALLRIKGHRLKSLLHLLALLALVGGFSAVGWVAPLYPGLTLPATVFILLLLGEWWRLRIRRRCRGEGPVRVQARPLSWRRPFTTLDLSIAYYEATLPGSDDLRFRVAHFSDLHVNHRLPLAYYRDALETVARLRADLVLATGDHVTWAEHVTMLRQVLRPLGRLGTFAILGNHDHWADPEGVSAALRESGVVCLGNEACRVTVPGGEIVLAGCEAPWGPTLHGLHEMAGPEPILVLTHTADNIYRLARSGAHAVFAGHYHGGQFRVPGIGPVAIPSVYGRRFDHGHFRVNGTHLFVTAGVGVAQPPLRVFCRPDVFVVDFRGVPETRETGAGLTAPAA
jgi:predicted MPP superfamily phosphohydrolase